MEIRLPSRQITREKRKVERRVRREAELIYGSHMSGT
jgi:hypothetical protein